jgi:GMP synthase-like glutamine amidotransferase
VKVLAFRHVPFEGPGRIVSVLEQRGIGCEYADLYLPDAPLPEISAYDGLIFMGGPMSANDLLPYLDRERALIGDAAVKGQPMLGICLGSQLIARSLGGDVHRNREKEIGFFDVHFTPEAAQDSLFSGISGPEKIFHWHGDTWELPPDAVRLAWSDACSNQAFRAGRNIYGLQFHLETPPEMIADWMGQEANCGDVRSLPSPIDPGTNCQRLDELSELVFGRWCSLL